MTTAYLNHIATAVPEYEVHAAFVQFATGMLQEKRAKKLFTRMVGKADINARYSVMPMELPLGGRCIDKARDFCLGAFPDTAKRMAMYEETAPGLMRRSVGQLRDSGQTHGITHVIVTSCTGLYAPGLDFDVIDFLGLDPSIERSMIGFMGCYAAVNALKLARHIVRSEPQARVLMLNLELCTLHLQETQDLEQVLSFLVFADGSAASIVSAEPVGFALDSFKAVRIPNTAELITWRIREMGFDMLLSGKVPAEIGQALRAGETAILGPGGTPAIDLWAIHPGGRTVLDAVEQGFSLPADALAKSREVLALYGNMSSATIMFVLKSLMEDAVSGQKGCGMAFGPGLTAETMMFHAA
jgi:predicted naringenin-chalcone synthase